MVEHIVMKELSGRHSDAASKQLLALREVVREFGYAHDASRAHYIAMAASGEGLLTVFQGDQPIGFVYQGNYVDGDRQMLIRGLERTFKGVKDDVQALDPALRPEDVYIARAHNQPEVLEQLVPAFERYRAEVLRQ